MDSYIIPNTHPPKGVSIEVVAAMAKEKTVERVVIGMLAGTGIPGFW
jgi:hypothetical protein